jgi:hypothetical protein
MAVRQVGLWDPPPLIVWGRRERREEVTHRQWYRGALGHLPPPPSNPCWTLGVPPQPLPRAKVVEPKLLYGCDVQGLDPWVMEAMVGVRVGCVYATDRSSHKQRRREKDDEWLSTRWRKQIRCVLMRTHMSVSVSSLVLIGSMSQYI